MKTHPPLLLSLALLLTPITLSAGLSEPNLTLYGKVINTIGGSAQTLHAGELVWTITPPGAAAFTVPVALENLDGGNYSYRLEIPVEKLTAGAVLPDGAIEASSGEKTYALAVAYANEPATLALPNTTPHAGTTAYRETTRGKIERVDVMVAVQALDSDGDGIPDWWEALYPLVMNSHDASDAAQDADGDGISNYQEYLDGTDPSCFEWTKWLARHHLTSPTRMAPDADPDRDGIPNLMEYALGTDPTTPDAALARARSRVEVVRSGGRDYLSFTVERPGTRHCNVDYLVEISNDLVTWRTEPQAGIVTLWETSTLRQVRDTVPLQQPDADNRFVRLKLSRKP